MRRQTSHRPSPAQMRETEMVVTVVGVDDRTGQIMVRDRFGNEVTIDGTVRGKAAGFPMEGERWLLERHGNVWVPAYMVGAPTPPTITGDREEDLVAVVQQVLDALVTLGLVYDQTTPEVFAPEVLEPPPTLLAEVVDPHDEVEPDEGPEPDPKTTDEDEDDPATERRTHDTFRIGTYNILCETSNTHVRKDLTRLTGSKVQIWGLQETIGAERNVLFTELDADGWETSRRSDGSNRGELAIIWRRSEFVKLAEGDTMFHGVTGAVPAKWGQWVRLRHRDSGHVLTVINAHPCAHVDLGGRPRVEPGNDTRLVAHRDEITGLVEMVKTHAKKGLVFLTGDYNVDYFRDNAHRHPDFPVAQFARIGVTANWRYFPKPKIGSHGGRKIDYVWRGPAPNWKVRYVKQRIVTGLHSDHRAVWVAIRVRRRDRRT